MDFYQFSNKDISLIIILNHLILISLDSLFIIFMWIANLSNFMIICPLNLTFDQLLFIFNLNLGVDLRDQLLLKYKLEFDNFGLFGILWLLNFY